MEVADFSATTFLKMFDAQIKPMLLYGWMVTLLLKKKNCMVMQSLKLQMPISIWL